MDKLKMHSPDLGQENIEELRELFPGCVTEAHDEVTGQLRLAVDFDQLKQELSAHIVDGPQERYRLDWPGKSQSALIGNSEVKLALRPDESISVSFETTDNLFIEGDNLDSLKLLRDSYLGKVKIIYIDPPYNTGKDFIYKDNFSKSKEKYDLDTSAIDEEGRKLVANTNANGRFHSDWLSMMYPRLRIAKQLLAEDGVVLISADDNEQHNIRKLCDEIFGEGSFVGIFSWRSRTAKGDVPYGVSNDVEWIIAYAKPKFMAGRVGERKYYKSDDHEDRWRLQDLTKSGSREERPNSFFAMKNPKTGEEFPASATRVWSVTKDTFQDYYDKGKIVFPGDYDFLDIKKPAYRVFETEDRAKALEKYGSETTRMSISTYLPEKEVGRTEHGSKEIRELFGASVFSYPKPSKLIRYFLKSIDNPNALIMDFFCGSGTTAHAVLAQNAEDGGNRQFVLVQLPEKLDPARGEQKAAYSFCIDNGIEPSLASLAQERIRRAGDKILEGECHPDWNRDVGFRVLKVASSNMEDVFYRPDDFQQKDIMEAVDNVKHGRTSEDLLFQVLVDWGVDLTLPIQRQEIQGKTVFFVDEDALIACFDQGVTEELVKELAKHKPLRVVFRDNGFESDSVKINAEQIFRQLSPTTEVKAV